MLKISKDDKNGLQDHWTSLSLCSAETYIVIHIGISLDQTHPWVPRTNGGGIGIDLNYYLPASIEPLDVQLRRHALLQCFNLPVESFVFEIPSLVHRRDRWESGGQVFNILLLSSAETLWNHCVLTSARLLTSCIAADLLPRANQIDRYLCLIFISRSAER